MAVNKTKKKREALCKSPTGTEEMAQWLMNTYSSRSNPSLNASMLKEHGPLFSPTQLAYPRNNYTEIVLVKLLPEPLFPASYWLTLRY